MGLQFLAACVLAWSVNLSLIHAWQQKTPLLAALIALILISCAQLVVFAVAEPQPAAACGRPDAHRDVGVRCQQGGIFVTDPDGRIISVNPAFTEITGFRQKKLSGAARGAFTRD